MAKSEQWLTIGGKKIGAGRPVYVIGEIGINHNGDLGQAKQLIDAAAAAGVNAVKFQKRTLEDIYVREALDDPNSFEEGIRYLLPILKEVEFGRTEYDQLFQYSQAKQLDFLCTPFDATAVEFLDPYDLAALKIASADLTNLPLLEKVVGTGRPLIMSTGMSGLDEIDQVAAFLRERGASFMLLHCVSAYPMPAKDAHLNFMKVLASRYQTPVGFSSHESGIEVTLAAVAAGAKVIERHITLDKSAEGPDHAASLEPDELADMMGRLRTIEEAMGGEDKKMSRIVIRNREALGKSLVALQDIAPGQVITREMVGTKGPAKGLSPLRFFDLVGRVATRRIRADDFFEVEDCETAVRARAYVPQFATNWGFKGRFTDLNTYREKYEPRFVEVHLNDKDLDYQFEELHRGQKYPFEIFLHFPTYWQRRVVNVAAENRADRQLAIEVVQRVIDLASRIEPYFEGTPKVIVHMGGMSQYEVKNNRRILDLAYDSMSRLDKEEVVFLPENNPPLPWYFAGQWYDNAFCAAQEMIDFCEAFEVKMCFDLSHARLYTNLVGEDYYQYVRTVAPYTQHLHIADAEGTGGEGVQIGEGEIDFERALKILSDYGQLDKMTWTPEIWQGHNNNAEGFLVAFQRLSKFSQMQSVEDRVGAVG